MKNKGLAIVCLVVAGWLLGAPGAISPAAERGLLKTPAEESGYTRYTQNADVARFLSELAQASPRAVVRTVGQTLAVDGFPAADLFVVVITEEGATSPAALNRDKPTVLLVASQHGNEQSAKEAALELCRDLATGELGPLLKSLNFLVMPQANPFGNYFDRRENEQDLDLNRDHVKLESPEVRAIHRVFRAWLPEVTVDLHEKGDDFYRVSIGCVSNANIDPKTQEFSRSAVLAEVERRLRKDRVTFHEYLVSEEMGVNTSAGANIRPEDLAGKEEMKRYSTTDLNDGRNSLGIYQTLSFIQECASRHDEATLAERTRWQYLGVRTFIETIAARRAEVLSLVRGLRSTLLASAGAPEPSGDVALKMDYARDEKQPTLTLEKFETPSSPVRGILKADKKAGEPVLASDLVPSPRPREYTVAKEIVRNWFPAVAVTLSVRRPFGYIVPAARRDIIECLLDHGVAVSFLARDVSLKAELYLARAVTPAAYDYLPPAKLDLEKREEAVVVHRGDFFVACAQPGADLIPCLLEPQSDFGFIRYRAFALVPQPGDFYSIYRIAAAVDLPLVPYCPWRMMP